MKRHRIKIKKKNPKVSEKSTDEIDESRGPKKKKCDTVGLKNKKKNPLRFRVVCAAKTTIEFFTSRIVVVLHTNTHA